MRVPVRAKGFVATISTVIANRHCALAFSAGSLVGFPARLFTEGHIGAPEFETGLD